MKIEKTKFNLAARVKVIQDMLYRPVYDEETGELLRYVRRHIISRRQAKRLLNSRGLK